MKINVSENVQQRIDALMATGEYRSVSELLAIALQFLGDTEPESQEFLAYVRREVAIGLDEEKQGLLEPFDAKEIIGECRAKAGLPPSSL